MVISKIGLEDDRLSWKARGLLAYLLSKPDNWEVMIAHLVKQGPDGKASVRAGLLELRDAGYIRSTRSRSDLGQFDGWETQVFEEPDTEVRKTDVGKPDVGKSDTNEDITRMIKEDISSSAKGGPGERTTTPPLAMPELPTPISELCDLLAKLIEDNGSRRPTVTAKWKTDMRLLHERDGRSFTQIENMIRWCQADDFWRANILSPAKLRAKYDQMRLRATSSARAYSHEDLEAQIDKALACILGAFNVPRETLTLPLSDALAERVRQRVSLREMGKMAPDQIRHLVAATAYDQKERHAQSRNR